MISSIEVVVSCLCANFQFHLFDGIAMLPKFCVSQLIELVLLQGWISVH
jgi:hypothetical protein